MMEVRIVDWGRVCEAFAVAARSFDAMVEALQKMPRVVITDELVRALDQAGRTGWMAGYRWRRDITRCISYGERIRVRPPRREKRRARKRRGKR